MDSRVWINAPAAWAGCRWCCQSAAQSPQPEALVVTKGAKGPISSSNDGVSIKYAEVSVLLPARYDFGVSKVVEFKTSSVRESAWNGAFAIYAGLAAGFGKE